MGLLGRMVACAALRGEVLLLCAVLVVVLVRSSQCQQLSCSLGHLSCLLSRGQTNMGYKNTNPDIHLLIFVSYKRNRILEE